MTLTLPNGPAGRFLALAVTFVALAMVWFAAAAPLLDWHAERADRLDQRRVLARRMADIAATLPELRQAMATEPGAAPGAARSALLDGTTDAIAAAALQQLVQEMAGRAGASLSTAETLPATQAGAYRRIGLHVSLDAPYGAIVRLLAAIEQATPRMLVDDLQFHGPRLVVQPPDPPIDAGFTVFAFRAGTAGPQSPVR